MQYWAKRIIDVSVAAIVLAAALPILAVTIVAILVILGQPVFFRQRRTGLNGRTFQLYKFRSMTDAYDQHGSALPDSERLTSFGRFLRNTSLDELPQLWNILRGDMALVGPRPLLLEYLPRYSERQRRRHDVKPGLSGWAQVHGRNSVSWDEKFELDVWYVEHRSVWLDLKILALTPGVVLARKSVSQEGHATMPPFSAPPNRSEQTHSLVPQRAAGPARANGQQSGKAVGTTQRWIQDWRSSSTSVRSTPAGIPSLSRNFTWALAANILYAACQWAMLVVLTKSSVTETVGAFGLALAVCAPVLMFANLQLRTVQATDAKSIYSFQEYMYLRLATTALALVTVTLICRIGHYARSVAAIIFAVAAWKCLDAISDMLYGYFQRHERIKIISISTMIKGVLALVLFSAALLNHRSLLLGLWGVAGAFFLVLVCYDIPSFYRLRSEMGAISGTGDSPQRSQAPSRSTFRLPQLAWVALPLGCVQLMVSLSANLPRYALEHSFGLRELGIYVAVSYFITVGLVVVNALGQAASPRLANNFAAGDFQPFRKLMAALLGIGLLLGIAGIVTATMFGPLILRLCYQPEYAAHSRTLVLTMVAAAVAYLAWLLGVGITATQTFRPQVAQLAVCTAATYFACLLLVPRWGADGAAAAFGVGMLIQAASAAIILHRRMGRSYLMNCKTSLATPALGL